MQKKKKRKLSKGIALLNLRKMYVYMSAGAQEKSEWTTSQY